MSTKIMPVHPALRTVLFVKVINIVQDACPPIFRKMESVSLARVLVKLAKRKILSARLVFQGIQEWDGNVFLMTRLPLKLW